MNRDLEARESRVGPRSEDEPRSRDQAVSSRTSIRGWTAISRLVAGRHDRTTVEREGERRRSAVRGGCRRRGPYLEPAVDGSTILMRLEEGYFHDDLREMDSAVGYIRTLIVAYPTPAGKILLATGPVFSQYEWKQPMANRLTDQAWREKRAPHPRSRPGRARSADRPRARTARARSS
jgi:hypothetical protein